jgi:hypothetical protein
LDGVAGPQPPIPSNAKTMQIIADIGASRRRSSLMTERLMRLGRRPVTDGFAC